MSDRASLNQKLYRYLRREVEDLLDAGLVGLYELPTFLEDELPGPDRRVYAEAVLADLVEDGRARLVWADWASDEPPTDAASAVPTDRDWSYPPAPRYMALAPADEA